jgi:hypothetical protein
MGMGCPEENVEKQLDLEFKEVWAGDNIWKLSVCIPTLNEDMDEITE